jgi:antitoxin VapB
MIYIEGRGGMARVEKAKVFISGRSQAVRIPAEYRFTTDEVYIRRDPQSGDLILSEAPGGWEEIFAALDKAGFPDNFLADRAQERPQEREDL